MDPMTCVHQSAGLCDSCRADYDEDPTAWVEFGNHVGGLARWRKLQEEMIEEVTRHLNVPTRLLTNDDIPF